MNFIVDAQLPPVLAARLTSHGHQSWHVGDIGPLDAPDRAVWAAARDRGCAVVTKDADFMRLAEIRLQTVAVLWLRIGNCGNARLIEVVLANIDAAKAAFAAGDTLVEIR